MPGYSPVDGIVTTAFLPQSMSVEDLSNGNKHFQVELQRLGNIAGGMNIIYSFGSTYSKRAGELFCQGTSCRFSFDIYVSDGDLSSLSYVVAEIKTSGEPLEMFESE
jgi:hypothetical protein